MNLEFWEFTLRSSENLHGYKQVKEAKQEIP